MNNPSNSRAGDVAPRDLAALPPPLAAETRELVDTATAAFHLCRRPQTLRAWSCLENGPLRPVRLHGRLGWPVSELRRLTAGAK
jgi:hypothetical protein